VALSLIRRCCSSNMSEEHTEEKRDKVRNGPCANIFADLEKCGIIKGVSGRAVSRRRTIIAGKEVA